MSNQAAYALGIPLASGGTAEFVILTSAVLPVSEPTGQGLLVEATIALTGAVSVTGCQIRFRSGAGLSGQILSSSPVFTVAGAVTADQALFFIDPTLVNITPGVQYTLTGQFTGAAGTIQQATMSVSPVTGSL